MQKERVLTAVTTRGDPEELLIIFLHGAGCTRYVWQPHLDALADEYRVVAADLPGHGHHPTDFFMCSTSVTDREKPAKQVLQIPGVVNVREIMTGQQDLRVKAVGKGTEDLTRSAHAIRGLDIDIEDEELIHQEYFQPYQPYGPEDLPEPQSMTNFMTLSSNAEVAELTVAASAPVVDKTLAETKQEDFLGEETLVITIERDGTIISPRGGTTLKPGGIVTLLSPEGSHLTC